MTIRCSGQGTPRFVGFRSVFDEKLFPGKLKDLGYSLEIRELLCENYEEEDDEDDDGAEAQDSRCKGGGQIVPQQLINCPPVWHALLAYASKLESIQSDSVQSLAPSKIEFVLAITLIDDLVFDLGIPPQFSNELGRLAIPLKIVCLLTDQPQDGTLSTDTGDDAADKAAGFESGLDEPTKQDPNLRGVRVDVCVNGWGRVPDEEIAKAGVTEEYERDVWRADYSNSAAFFEDVDNTMEYVAEWLSTQPVDVFTNLRKLGCETQLRLFLYLYGSSETIRSHTLIPPAVLTQCGRLGLTICTLPEEYFPSPDEEI